MKALILVTLVCLQAILGGCSDGSPTPGATPAEEAPPAPPGAAASDATGPAPAATVSSSGAAHTLELPDFASLVDRYGNAVVNVDVVGRAQTAGASPTDDPLYDFFRRFGVPPPNARPRGEAPLLRGSGSGFIVSPDGYILTNAHVVAPADEVTVRLTDRREFPARVIGVDARTDVAVIKIDAKDLPIVRVGDRRKLRTGEWVLAIGSPFGLDNTATAGIVSATARSVGVETDVPFIQTDVAVNPGNSGGPLFNLDGEVVGINSMIFSQTGGYMGISFAIPIDVALQVRDQLVKHGRVVRGRIGVAVQNVDAALARSFGLDRPRGALVSAVDKSGPAQRAGVRAGDVILRVDGQPIDQSAQLSSAISQRKPGEEATLDIWRSRKQRQVTVRIEELKEPVARVARQAPADSSEEGARLGVTVRELTPQEKRSVGTEGAVVVASASGPAARAGVQPGDVILAINDTPVRSVRDLRASAMRLDQGATAALLIEREGAQLFVPVRTGKG